MVMGFKFHPFRRLHQRYTGKRPKHVEECWLGDFNLVIDSPSWGRMRHPLPPHFRQVGPIYWAPELPEPDFLSELDPDRPLVYITLGTILNELELLERLLGAFAASPFQVVMTTGGRVKVPEKLVPPNARVLDWIHGDRIMERASVAVHMGGTGSSYQAIRALTPTVVIACHLEQQWIGEAAEATGAGVWMTLQEAIQRPARVREAAIRLLGEREERRKTIQLLRDEMSSLDPVRLAGDTLEQWMGVRPSSPAR
jgi:UDP:flavonoid glycosyltransferase YjiC (YdhE family)